MYTKFHIDVFRFTNKDIDIIHVIYITIYVLMFSFYSLFNVAGFEKEHIQ